MERYGDRLKAHLAEYKRLHLRTERSGTWLRSNAEYAHILHRDDLRLNILPSIRGPFWEAWESWQRKPRPPKLHRDFAHLNSSQAFAFNLFFPYLTGDRRDGDTLLAALGVEPEPIVEWEFEKVLDRAEGTNFDVWMRLESGDEVCVEVKLSESDFGTSIDDARHRNKLETRYRPELAEMVDSDQLEPPAFFRRYQILRNVMYAASGRRQVVFVFPERNEGLRDGRRFIGSVVRMHRNRVRTVLVEPMMEALSRGGSDRLREHVELLRTKYLLAPTNDLPLSLARPYSIEDYRDQKATLVKANRDSCRISIVAFLPNPPGEPWSSIGDRLRGTESPVRFLSFLFGDLVLDPTREEPDDGQRVVIDGFLGCAGYDQSPWLLLPTIGTWLRSSGAIRGAIRHLDVALTAWQQEGRELRGPALGVPLDDAVGLGPFVPHGRIPNARIVRQFVSEALQLILSRDRKSEAE